MSIITIRPNGLQKMPEDMMIMTVPDQKFLQENMLRNQSELSNPTTKTIGRPHFRKPLL